MRVLDVVFVRKYALFTTLQSKKNLYGVKIVLNVWPVSIIAQQMQFNMEPRPQIGVGMYFRMKRNYLRNKSNTRSEVFLNCS